MRARPEIAAATGLAERMFDKCVMSAQALESAASLRPNDLMPSEDGGAAAFLARSGRRDKPPIG